MKGFFPKKKEKIFEDSCELIRIQSEILRLKEDFYKTDKPKSHSEK